MKTYKAIFKTSMTQEKPFTKFISAHTRVEAVEQLKLQAQITSRFIISCKLAK